MAQGHWGWIRTVHGPQAAPARCAPKFAPGECFTARSKCAANTRCMGKRAALLLASTKKVRWIQCCEFRPVNAKSKPEQTKSVRYSSKSHITRSPGKRDCGHRTWPRTSRGRPAPGCLSNRLPEQAPRPQTKRSGTLACPVTESAGLHELAYLFHDLFRDLRSTRGKQDHKLLPAITGTEV